METRMILAINPGSTSTKIAVFDGEKQIFLKNIKHSVEEIAPFKKITDQFDFRKEVILKELKDAGIQLETLKIIVGRGGLVKPVPSGVFLVNDKMKHDLRNSNKDHASNLGGLIADDIVKSLNNGAVAVIADPVVVDEMDDVARIAGHPLFQRVSIFHALNQKAVARKYAKSVSKKYEEVNVIVAHLGGGISVGAHRKGRVVDVNQALDGEGPFSPERSGTLPAGDVCAMAFSGKYTHDEMKLMFKGKGGFAAYLGTNDAYEVEKRCLAGDKEAIKIHDAMIYQVAKDIGANATVLKGQVDAIILTGGIAYNPDFNKQIEERTAWIAPVVVYPGEDEMAALAMNGLMVIEKEVEPVIYT
ncbi:TPA: butyrate kinase [Candidatus Delongbacteria bacterium]|nr:MAG: butyrate kinase [Candidatus Delongbacteria bacterium GWF2_40_14]HAQ61439.1 butyrate kinase [Candidatus Delongbacteria bacterium]